MPTVATPERAANLAGRGQTEDIAPRLFEPGGATLEDSILGVWEELAIEGRAECPVCGGSMSLAGGCSDCGSELS